MQIPIEATRMGWHGPRLTAATRLRTQRRGFTMVELMTVVVIVGVLATVAIFGVLRYIASAKAAEAMAMINSIRSAEEAYRDETFVYLGLNQFNTVSGWHPMNGDEVGAHKANWLANNGAASDIFRQLGVESNNPVYFTYTVVAARTGTSLPAPPTSKTFNFPNPVTEPAYIVVAKGDLDGDKKYSYVLSHSFSGEIYVEREGE